MKIPLTLFVVCLINLVSFAFFLIFTSYTVSVTAYDTWITLLADSEGKLQKLLDMVTKEGKKKGLTIKFKKIPG